MARLAALGSRASGGDQGCARGRKGRANWPFRCHHDRLPSEAGGRLQSGGIIPPTKLESQQGGLRARTFRCRIVYGETSMPSPWPAASGRRDGLLPRSPWSISGVSAAVCRWWGRTGRGGPGHGCAMIGGGLWLTGRGRTSILGGSSAWFSLPTGAFPASWLGREWKGMTVNWRRKRFTTGSLGGM
jgi:hypothetical protein